MKHLGIDPPDLIKGGIHTAREISQQPELWESVFSQMLRNEAGLKNFLEPVLVNTRRIILTGAGTSAFIGISLRGLFQRKWGAITESIATTDIVSHPGDYLIPNVPTLMISFARSGNSPESVATIALADEIIQSCHHIIITCSAEGKLVAAAQGKGNCYILVLPERANDKSLAMTSSYTGMMVSAILLANYKDTAGARTSVNTLVNYGQTILRDHVGKLKEVASLDFHRGIFLGSGPLYGTALESHLKLQELTDGKVICKNDSYLGFRHGPRAVVDKTSLVVYLLSNNSHAVKYEKDLIESMRKNSHPLLEILVSEAPTPGITIEHTICLGNGKETVAEEYLAVCYVLIAQVLGFFKSIQLGLNPDSPSVNGAISRVVKGVNIYDVS